jgi:hypothetical protein
MAWWWAHTEATRLRAGASGPPAGASEVGTNPDYEGPD